MNEITIIEPASSLDGVVEATLNSVGAGSRPVYAGAIVAFRSWAAEHHYEDAYASLMAYRRSLEERGLQFSTINRHMSALRKFMQTAYHMNQLPEEVWKKIQEVGNIHTQGQKRGNWLSAEQAQALLNAPDASTLQGARDRAILALMLGCGLRRSEITHLRWDHLVERDDVWIIENLLGKHNRVRSIPLQRWVATALIKYNSFTLRERDNQLNGQYVFWSIDRYGNWGTSISSQAIWLIVAKYAKQCGFTKLAPHDLRRTYAELARRSGAELEEVQALLGHSSLAVTQRYLETGVDPQRISQLIDMEI